MATLLLNCIHYIAAVFSYFRYWLFRIQAISFHKTDSCVVQADARKLKKLPLHLGLLLLEDDFSYTDIANVVLWSATMGVTFISIYDRNGTIKANRTLLEREIQKKQQSQLDGEYTRSEICFHSGLFRHNAKHKVSSHIDVFLLSLEDGRQSIINTAKHICRRVSENLVKTSDITPQSVDVIFQGRVQNYS